MSSINDIRANVEAGMSLTYAEEQDLMAAYDQLVEELATGHAAYAVLTHDRDTLVAALDKATALLHAVKVPLNPMPYAESD